jgi:hypothetical protein
MGNSLWIQKHVEGGETVPLDETAMEEIFGRYAIRREAECWVLELGNQEGGELYYRAGGDSAMFAHYGGPRLLALIFEFLKRASAVAYWPDVAPCGAVTDAAVLSTLPQDMVEAIRPTVVSSPEELDLAICGRLS